MHPNVCSVAWGSLAADRVTPEEARRVPSSSARVAPESSLQLIPGQGVWPCRACTGPFAPRTWGPGPMDPHFTLAPGVTQLGAGRGLRGGALSEASKSQAAGRALSTWDVQGTVPGVREPTSHRPGPRAAGRKPLGTATDEALMRARGERPPAVCAATHPSVKQDKA